MQDSQQSCKAQIGFNAYEKENSSLVAPPNLLAFRAAIGLTRVKKGKKCLSKEPPWVPSRNRTFLSNWNKVEPADSLY